MKQAPVSVIIPAYNCAHLIGQAIDSLLAQTVAPNEIIVVDDGSSDNLTNRLQPYEPSIRYIRQQNQGCGAARNTGIAAATGQFLAFLDADDVWHPRKLELQMRAFQWFPQIGALGAGVFDWPARQFPQVGLFSPELVAFVPRRNLLVRNCLGVSSVIVTRDAIDLAGAFDPALRAVEDRDLWMRIMEVAPVANLRMPLMGYRHVVGSLSRQAVTCETAMRHVLRKLDQRDAWNGDWLLRRKAYAQVNHSCAYLHSAVGNHSGALLRSLRSILGYPFPFRRDEVDRPFSRLKRLAVTFLRLLHLKSPDRPVPTALPQDLPDVLATLKHPEAQTHA